MSKYIVIPKEIWDKVYLEAKSSDTYESLNELENSSKQISLNEKDMNIKVAEALVIKNYDVNSDEINAAGAGGFCSGYKQALLDIKKEIL